MTDDIKEFIRKMEDALEGEISFAVSVDTMEKALQGSLPNFECLPLKNSRVVLDFCYATKVFVAQSEHLRTALAEHANAGRELLIAFKEEYK